ncbi:MAG: lysophospholipid acyltransferase family protein [Candidatus Caldatribacteriota bacterium]|nr:lysophospholipid acyltransferase family protein [Candidatus Caldatribacteriota bacterium]
MFYHIAKAIGWILFKIFWRMEIIGSENIPKKGPLIIASNHASYLDPLILGISMKRNVHFIAKKEVFNNVFGNFICRKLNAFPVDREKIIDMTALKTSIHIVQCGKVLGIFPEGRRSNNGKLQEFKLGIIKIAMKTGAPILPVGIIGSNRIYPRGKIFPTLFRHKIIVRYGSPKYLESKNNRDKDYQKESLDMISEQIKTLTSR